MAKMRQHPTEHQICATFMDMVNAALATHQVNHPERFLCAHIPNGQSGGNQKQRTIAGAMDKRRGVKRGFPDYFVSYWRGIIQEIMFLEFKTITGTQTPEQKLFQKWCEKVGYEYHLVRSAEEGIEVLKKRYIINDYFRVM